MGCCISANQHRPGNGGGQVVNNRPGAGQILPPEPTKIKQPRKINDQLTNDQKKFIIEFQPKYVWDHRALYKIFANYPKTNHMTIVLDRRLGFSQEKYQDSIDQKTILHTKYELKQAQNDLVVLKLSFNQQCKFKNLSQTLAETHPTLNNNEQMIKNILRKMIDFLDDNQHMNACFNFNPDQILVFKDEDNQNMVLQPQILIEMDDEKQDKNEVLKVRWNITIDKIDREKIEGDTIQLQNKLSLALLMYHIETDGFVPYTLPKQYVEILTNIEKRTKYLASFQINNEPIYFKFLIQNILKPYHQLQKELQKVPSNNNDKKYEKSRILDQVYTKRVQQIFIDEILQIYASIQNQERQQRLVELFMNQVRLNNEVELTVDEIDQILKVIDLDQEHLNQKFEKFRTNEVQNKLRIVNKRVFYLQILSWIETFDKIESYRNKL
ncbi:UNKNOWN [Stylonychia lemnae]|uniref:Uncharacterized protein n=1 Tax=Stylonychia lemnae TaxID=5949 RepID=A0A078B795_STYLE|nr:UNKNOWN [Stylonychia lemnae]|eukprot:CDW89428.1 UNKNOWN [Stylonychia lemnae]